MKQIIIVILSLFFIFFTIQNTTAQINPFKKIKEKTDKKLDKEMDKTLDRIFEKDKKKENKKDKESQNSVTVDQLKKTNQKLSSTEKPILKWSKFDFIPGDKIIFEDNLIGEENGEFPSRWDLMNGNVENAIFGNDKVIMFRGGNPIIVPYIENLQISYLPDIFTIEFDLHLPYNSFTVYFYDKKNQRAPLSSTYLNIWSTVMKMSPAESKLPDDESINKKWAHIAIAYTKGKMKAYINETRLINIPHLSFKPTGVSLQAYHANNENRYYIKNFRIAAGGVKYYDRFLQNGKIISNGIRFETGIASLRPESMGVLNEIHKLLSEHSEINFSIEGHTDSNGDSDFNQKLSEDRAKTVMNQLISMGIDSNRLSFKGYGESNPIETNNSPEGKASNRRVEFVKTN